MPSLGGRRSRAARAALWTLGAAAAVALGLAALLRPPAPPAPPAADVALAGLVLVEPEGARRADVTLVARGGRIEALAEGPLPGASTAFAGRFALPGLVDLHVHHPPAFAPGQRTLFGLLHLAHGVTSVRDTGAFGGSLAGHAARIARGELPGPRIFACGPILDGEPVGWPGARAVTSPDEARRAVAELAAEGAACVKLYNAFDPESFAAAAEAAATHGLPAVAHVPWSMALEELPRGVEVQHLMGLADDWAEVRGADVERYVAQSARGRLVHTPTLVTYARAARLDDPAALAGDAAARLLPAFYRERLWSLGANPLLARLIPAGPPEARARIDVMRRVVARLRASGVPVRAGSDVMNPYVVPGAGLVAELGELAAAGFTPEETLALATRGAGEALRVPDLGRLVTGAPADLALYREDPTRDLAALATLEAVVAAGRLYTVEDLLAAAARARAHADRFPYGPLADWTARAGIAAVTAAAR